MGPVGWSLIKWGWTMVLCAVTLGCPLGSGNRQGLLERPPPPFVLPSSSLQQLIWLLCSWKEFLGGHSDHKEPRNHEGWKPRRTTHELLSANPVCNERVPFSPVVPIEIWTKAKRTHRSSEDHHLPNVLSSPKFSYFMGLTILKRKSEGYLKSRFGARPDHI